MAEFIQILDHAGQTVLIQLDCIVEAAEGMLVSKGPDNKPAPLFGSKSVILTIAAGPRGGIKQILVKKETASTVWEFLTDRAHDLTAEKVKLNGG